MLHQACWKPKPQKSKKPAPKKKARKTNKRPHAKTESEESSASSEEDENSNNGDGDDDDDSEDDDSEEEKEKEVAAKVSKRNRKADIKTPTATGKKSVHDKAVEENLELETPQAPKKAKSDSGALPLKREAHQPTSPTARNLLDKFDCKSPAHQYSAASSSSTPYLESPSRALINYLRPLSPAPSSLPVTAEDIRRLQLAMEEQGKSIANISKRLDEKQTESPPAQVPFNPLMMFQPSFSAQGFQNPQSSFSAQAYPKNYKAEQFAKMQQQQLLMMQMGYCSPMSMPGMPMAMPGMMAMPAMPTSMGWFPQQNFGYDSWHPPDEQQLKKQE